MSEKASKIDFLGKDLIIPAEISQDVKVREHLALVEYIELTKGDGLWFFNRMRGNYKLSFKDEEFESRISKILEDNQTRGLQNVKTN